MNMFKSLFIAITVLTLVGGVTYAFFSDTGTNTANTFTAGTLDLKLDGSDDVTATWALPNMAPGDSVSGSVALTNTGSLTANHVEINPITNTITDVNNDATPDIDSYLQITAASYDGDDLLAAPGKQLVDSNGNGWYDLDDLESAANSAEGGILDNLSAPAAAGASTKTLAMTVEFRTDAGNVYQGDSDTLDLTFTLNQDASQ